MATYEKKKYLTSKLLERMNVRKDKKNNTFYRRYILGGLCKRTRRKEIKKLGVDAWFTDQVEYVMC